MRVYSINLLWTRLPKRISVVSTRFYGPWSCIGCLWQRRSRSKRRSFVLENSCQSKFKGYYHFDSWHHELYISYHCQQVCATLTVLFRARTCTYQFVVAWLELYVVCVAHEQLTHELEILDRELVAVVHELNVLFTDAPLDRSRHLYLTRTVLCQQWQPISCYPSFRVFSLLGWQAFAGFTLASSGLLVKPAKACHPSKENTLKGN